MMIASAAAALIALVQASQPAKPANNSCVACHEPQYTVLQNSIHKMVSCVACHGGDLRLRKTLPEEEQKARAHSATAPEPFVAKPEDKCFRCHKNETEAFNRGAHGLPMKSRSLFDCKGCHSADQAAPSAHTIRKISFDPGGLPGRLRTGAEGSFAHRIGVFDEKKRLIGGRSVEPYSPMATCGKCHDYAAISGGRHFQAGRPGAEDGRPGEPWMLCDAASGTQVPLSYRSWAGTWRPADLAMTDWEFALRFGSHHPGGGPLEWTAGGKRRDSAEEPGPDGKGAASRWKSGGVLGIDCLACHLAGPYNREERASLVRAGQFRHAPGAAAGLSAARPSVKKITPDGDEVYEPLPLSSVKPSAPGEGILAALHDASRFDAEGRVLLDVTRHPPARNCLACHAVNLEASNGVFDVDVHMAAGLGCTDCHRNGIDHQIARCDGGEIDRKHDPANATLSCRGCHATGRLGAPPIPHRGMPYFHLEKIACTTCHSGPWPEGELQRVQTARAHGLGLIAQDEPGGRALPAVWAPVYRHDGEGLIRPHFAVWPSWFGRMKDGRPVPLPLVKVKEAVDEVRSAAADAGAAPDDRAVLEKLREKGVEDPVRVAGGRMYRIEGGRLEGREAPESGAYMWPIGHWVRPAAQALGSGGCSDCHSVSSPFFFGSAVPPGFAGPDAAGRKMHENLGLSAGAIRLGALAVMMREGGMKLVAVLLVLGLLAAALGHMAVGARAARVLGIPEVRASGPAPDLGLPLRWVHFCAWALLLVLVVTGAGFLVTYGPSPLPSFFSSRHAVRLHVASGLVFAALVPILALAWIVLGEVRKRGPQWVNAWGGFLWMARGRGGNALSGWDRLWIWLDLACALCVAGTGLIMSMRVPVVGSLAGAALRSLPDHHLLGPLAYALHGMAGAVLIGRLALHIYAALFLRKRS